MKKTDNSKKIYFLTNWITLESWHLFLEHFHIICYFIKDELQHYGIDWESPISGEDSSERVEVPNTPVPLSEQQQNEVKRIVNPLEPCDQ
jgi:hypothetical protein